MNEFMIFVAPFIITIVSIVLAFLLAPMDKIVKDEEVK
ncbi:hypothetical protein ACH0B5_11900 [Ureibacillus sp. 179-F W5.1 NHS]